MTNYVSGKVQVTARGFWFTAGGEKGTFGYYPHLKDSDGAPVYPDTQLHGDLKMAASWLYRLNPQAGALPQEDIFGSGGGDEYGAPSRPSRLFLGDLEIVGDSRSRWFKNPQFTIKSRIQIDDDTKTVAEHFLVDLELADLDSLTLEAPFILGPFSQSDLTKAKEVMDNAVSLLSGFGAFRSRGYGRGEVKIIWEETQNAAVSTHNEMIVSLTALTHVRNKPVDPGSAQVIDAAMCIDGRQFKGWLSKTYFDTYGSWPQPKEMAALQVSTFYPAPAKNCLTYPPAMSTLVNEKEKVRDLHGCSPDERKRLEMGLEEDNFFSAKAKPLGADWFVDDKKNAQQYITYSRIRNSMDNSSFTTRKNGLFSQDFLPRGTIFCGRISTELCSKEFAKNVAEILGSIRSVIKGAVFEVSTKKDIDTRGAEVSTATLLVTEPVPFSAELAMPDNAITLATQRRYNTKLKRPRRSQPVIQPGAILKAGFYKVSSRALHAWNGFNSDIEAKKASSGRNENQQGNDGAEGPLPSVETDIRDHLYKVTRAQAGQLREMLHPSLGDQTILNSLTHRIEKYKTNSRSFGHLLVLLEWLRDKLESGGRARMNDGVRALLDAFALIQWEKKGKGEPS